MAAPVDPNHGLPHRSTTHTSAMSDDEAVPAEDASEVTNLFSERLRAWKHACGYLESYIEATEKLHKDNAKEYEKVLKTVSSPLKEADHFDPSLGGIGGVFENLRSNTQGLANSHTETAKTLKGSILPIFERLHSEVKSKTKELTKGAGKGAKAVDKARKDTQKHIELLGQHSAAFDSSGGKVTANDDPYVLQRGVMHRLNKQVMEENNNRNDLLAVQNAFATFEAHIIQSIQSGMGQFNAVVAKQADATKTMYGDVTTAAQRVPLDFEWNGFVKRNHELLIDPHAPPRTVANISFPNQTHRATQPLIAGGLDRKGKIMKRYDTGYYAVTPSKFLHEYKTDDNFAKEPVPEMSLYLPDCVVGALDGQKFAIKGKDASKGKLAISMAHELQFKAHSTADAQKWYMIIREAAGSVTDEKPDSSVPNSPVAGSGDSYGSLAGGAAAGTAAGTAAGHHAAPGQPGALNTAAQPGALTDHHGVASPVAGAPHSGVAAGDHALGSTGHTGAAAPMAGQPAVDTAAPMAAHPDAGTAAPMAAHPAAATGAPASGAVGGAAPATQNF